MSVASPSFKVSRHLLFVAELGSCVRKSRWPSWAPVPNKPTVSVAVKQHSTNSAFRSPLLRELFTLTGALNFYISVYCCVSHSL